MSLPNSKEAYHGQKLTIQDMRDLAKRKGGECLSSEYVNNGANLRWRCAAGHEWEATPGNVGKPNGTWCPDCAGRRPRTLEEMVAIAKERGGSCLSRECKGVGIKLLWRCKNNHEFWMAPSHVVYRNQWCPLCSRYVSERVCRGILEALFQEEFPKARPGWLVTSQGNEMELDGYCAKLGLAFEYMGEQHYREVRHFHRHEQSFSKRKQDDARKSELCREHGIYLFLVSYVAKYSEIEGLIREEAKNQCIPVPRTSRVDWKGLPGIYDPGYLGRMQKMAHEHGGECLSKTYINASTKLRWRCAKGHEWVAEPNHIQAGTWCPQCCGRNNPRSLSMVQAIAKERGGQCLSKVYKRNEAKLRWRCAKGHVWLASPDKILQKHWCPVCGGSQRNSIADIRRLADARGGKCLSRSYVNNRTALKWRCSRGHIWWAVPAGIQSGRWCPKCRDLHSGDSQRLTIEDMHATALERGGTCLSTEYRNNSTELRWRCDKGHEWKATPGHVRNGRWCPECKRAHAGESQRFTMDDMQKMAHEHGGKCVSEVYVNNSTKLRWRCAEGHEWEAVPNSVQQDHWCPVCARRAAAEKLRRPLLARNEAVIGYVKQNPGASFEHEVGPKFGISGHKVSKIVWRDGLRGNRLAISATQI